MNKYKDLTVAIISQDMKKAKLISQALRKSGVIPYVMTDFNEFWKSTERAPAHLNFIDVLLTSEGERNLAGHPAFNKSEVQSVLFCDSNSRPLLYSMTDFRSLGYLQVEDAQLNSRVSSILDSYMSQRETIKENMRLKKNLHLTEQRLSKVVEDKQKSYLREEYRDLISNFTNKIDHKMSEDDFFQSFCSVADKFDFIKSFAFVEPTLDGNKLMSPYFSGSKYKVFPSLHLGAHKCVKGISRLSQGLSHQVAYDLLGSNIQMIELKINEHDLPQALIYLEVGPEHREFIDWSMMSSLLSGFYCKSLLMRVRHMASEKNYLSTWAFYGAIENITKDSHKLYFLDFTKIFNVIESYPEANFQWQYFAEHYQSALHARLDLSYKASIFDPLGIVFLIDQDDAEAFETGMSGFYKSFSYWRYFENSELILAESLVPRFRIIEAKGSSFRTFINSMRKRDTIASQEDVVERISHPALGLDKQSEI